MMIAVQVVDEATRSRNQAKTSLRQFDQGEFHGHRKRRGRCSASVASSVVEILLFLSEASASSLHAAASYRVSGSVPRFQREMGLGRTCATQSRSKFPAFRSAYLRRTMRPPKARGEHQTVRIRRGATAPCSSQWFLMRSTGIEQLVGQLHRMRRLLVRQQTAVINSI
jgi:hypothetical protein